MKSKKAQEEMVGFALIIIVVSIILLVFVGFSLRDNEKESVESYEVESFLQAALQYTTTCEDNFEQLSMQKVIYLCQAGDSCLSGENPCQIMSTELQSLTESSWKTGTERPVKGYELLVISRNQTLMNLTEGIKTINSKGSVQYLPKEIEVYFTAYY